MSTGAVFIWIVQSAVIWLAYRDLGRDGSRFLARSLGIESSQWVWVWLFGLTIVSLFLDSRIAANTFAAYAGKRPYQDWSRYAESGASPACYWCGLTSFALSLLAAALLPDRAGLAAGKAAGAFVFAIVVNAVLIRAVVDALFRRRYGQVKRRSELANVRFGVANRRFGSGE
jgi:hypothetical protein